MLENSESSKNDRNNFIDLTPVKEMLLFSAYDCCALNLPGIIPNIAKKVGMRTKVLYKLMWGGVSTTIMPVSSRFLKFHHLYLGLICS